MSVLIPPFAVKSNAIIFPSGDQRGQPTDPPALPREVSWRGCLPCPSTTQISVWPLRTEVNATCSPSGENCGLASSSVDGANRVWTSPVACPRRISRRQMSQSVVPCE